jgi:hypothetical protein
MGVAGSGELGAAGKLGKRGLSHCQEFVRTSQTHVLPTGYEQLVS